MRTHSPFDHPQFGSSVLRLDAQAESSKNANIFLQNSLTNHILGFQARKVVLEDHPFGREAVSPPPFDTIAPCFVEQIVFEFLGPLVCTTIQCQFAGHSKSGRTRFEFHELPPKVRF